jgi:hypothetical protein
MTARKETAKRLEELTLAVKHKLEPYQLGRLLTIPDLGILDINTFNIRFKLYPVPTDDMGWLIINMASMEDFDSDFVFIELVRRGYLHWLRLQSSGLCFSMLEHNNRWGLILKVATGEAQERNLGGYRLKYIQYLSSQKLTSLYTSEPAIFDWPLGG